MDLKKLGKSKDEDEDDETTELSNQQKKLEYRKNVFRTEDQRMAAFYFSDENVKPEVAVETGCKNQLKGCFKKKEAAPEVEEKEIKVRPYFDEEMVTGVGALVAKTKKTSHYLSDSDYDALVKKIVDGYDFKNKALEALCVDESEVKEIEPIHFGGRLFDDDGKRKLGEDWRFRTTGWQETWLFFSATSLMAYQIDFSTDNNTKIERTWEYQYKDITAIKITEDTKEIIDDDGQRFKKDSKFVIAVPNDILICSFNNNNEEVYSIKAMKAMIRDKKNN